MSTDLKSGRSAAARGSDQSPLLLPMRAVGERGSVEVVRGRGARLTLADGREVVDGGSMSSTLVGHCHPAIVEAVQRAASTVNVQPPVAYAPREDAARDVLRTAFGDEPWAEVVAFFVSASEAVELALLLTQELTGRLPLVCRELSYHGSVGLAREVSVHPLWRGNLVGRGDAGSITGAPTVSTVRRLPIPSCTPDPGSAHRCKDDCLANADSLLSGAAAVVMDYSQGAVVPSPQYQDTLSEVARGAGAYWIADETVTSFGRMGKWFAFQRGSSRPDIVALGKGLTGGAVPGGALVLSADVVEALDGRRWATNSTYRGHPLVAAAVSATLRVIAEEALVERAATLGEHFGSLLRELPARHECVKDVVGEGLLWFVRLATPPEFSENTWEGDGSRLPLTQVIQRAALEHGAFVGAPSGEALYIVPPLVITTEELNVVSEAIDAALTIGDESLAQIST